MDTVLIRGLEVTACHGVHGFEKTTPQRFIFDADLMCDFYAAAQSDNLNDTINYSAACNLIAEITQKNVFNLIEKLAYECAFTLMDNFPQLKGVKLTVYKPEAPVKHKFGTVGVTAQTEREKVYLSLGSSIGDRKQYLDSAVKLLGSTRGIKIEKVSSYLQTEPYGGVAKNRFLNCAVKAETYLSPFQLLTEIHRIENALGRERKQHWADRTLDIDIIFFGSRIISEENLIIPHPEYFKRNFVLTPLKEIAPDFVCPVQKKRICEITI